MKAPISCAGRLTTLSSIGTSKAKGGTPPWKAYGPSPLSAPLIHSTSSTISDAKPEPLEISQMPTEDDSLGAALMLYLPLLILVGALTSLPQAGAKEVAAKRGPLPRPPTRLAQRLRLPARYTKYLDALGLPVVSSKAVEDSALREAAWRKAPPRRSGSPPWATWTDTITWAYCS